jgi:hypothetical protein
VAAEAGELEVGEGDIEGVVGEERESGFAAGFGGDGVAIEREDGGEELGHDGVVVDDQDAERWGGGGHWCVKIIGKLVGCEDVVEARRG